MDILIEATGASHDGAVEAVLRLRVGDMLLASNVCDCSVTGLDNLFEERAATDLG